MEHDGIKLLRFEESIPSKKNKIPEISSLFNRQPVKVRKHTQNRKLTIIVPPEAIDTILGTKHGVILMHAFTDTLLPGGIVVSRFLAKMALEFMALRLIDSPCGLDYIVDETQLDPIRLHAREGKTLDWPYSVRRIYNVHKQWRDLKGNSVQVIHEMDILGTDCGEVYFIVALFGLEFAINVGGPAIEGYFEWLKHNNGVSPLHSGKNKNWELY